MAIENIYSDIDFDLKKTQYSDFTVLNNIDAIRRSIENIILSHKGIRTKFQNPYFGSMIHRLLFEKMSVFTTIQLEEEIKNSIDTWEPRIKIIKILVKPDYSKLIYNIEIFYNVINININDNLILSVGVLK